MENVRFGDVVREVKEKIDRNRNPYEFYVAGDHMDTEDLTIRRRGKFATDDVGPAFIRKFRAGQILYGSRRTYLKKIAVADFDGVTANTTFVLETKDESVLSQRLIPFIMLSDRFTDWSVTNSKGSTNPYALFSDIAGYEFALPDMPTQRKLAELLWAMVDAQNAYKKLISATDELVSAQFVERFGNPIVFEKNENFPQLGQVCMLKAGVFIKADNIKKENSDGLYPCFGGNGCRGYVSDYMHDGEFPIIGRQGALCGNVQYARGKFHATEHAVVVTPRVPMDRYWIYHMLKLLNLNRYAKGAAQPGLSVQSLEKIHVQIPVLTDQKSFSLFARQSDKSKLALNQALADLTATYKRIIAENLC